MSLLATQIRQLVEDARPHAHAAIEHCRRLDDDAALADAGCTLDHLRALPGSKRYGLLEQAAELILDLRNELADLRKMKDLGYRERFRQTAAEAACLQALEIRHKVNGMRELKAAAETIRTLRFRIERTWSAPRKCMQPERFRDASPSEVDEDEADDAPISPLLLKLVARKNQSTHAGNKKGARESAFRPR